MRMTFDSYLSLRGGSMKFPVSWLKDFGITLSHTEIVKSLTQLGLEVDQVIPVAPDFSGVVIGEILTASRHPNADRLQVCTVSIGTEVLSIVCGAPNARPGIKVCVAVIGAVLPGDFKIKAAKIREVASSGMLCSEKELGFSETQPGILELPLDAPLGLTVRDYLELNDFILEVDLTANRGDCLSILGLARELAALHPEVLWIHPTVPEQVFTQTSVWVHKEAQAACPRYTLSCLDNLSGGASSPVWLQRRLARSGITPKNLIVDVTNHIMLSVGQPLHAFDADQIQGDVQVRFARPGEPLELLDGKTIVLHPQDLVIADSQGPIALAGIMGGKRTAISEHTQKIALESAFFTPEALAGRARFHGLHTDSSHRFERGVDPQLPLQAAAMAIDLLKKFGRARVISAGLCAAPTEAHTKTQITLTAQEVTQCLGMTLPLSRIRDILVALHCQVSEHVGVLTVTPPSYRFDLNDTRDLIEEVARLMGYDHIPAIFPTQLAPQINTPSMQKVSVDRIKQLLVDRGYHEAVTYSFIDPQSHQRVFGDRPKWVLQNPISEELSVMREGLLPGLLKAVAYNLNRQQDRVRLFEIGRCFKETLEMTHLGIIITGSLMPVQWRGKQASDFFDLKSDIEALLRVMVGPQVLLSFTLDVDPSMEQSAHPGQKARLRVDHREIGVLYRVHPALEHAWGLTQPVFFAEVMLDHLPLKILPTASGVSKFPAITRDLALEMPHTVSAGLLESSIKASGGEHLIAVTVFDVYQGKGIAEGMKSMAVRLIFQEVSGTLLDEVVDTYIKKLLDHVAKTCHAHLRG